MKVSVVNRLKVLCTFKRIEFLVVGHRLLLRFRLLVWSFFSNGKEETRLGFIRGKVYYCVALLVVGNMNSIVFFCGAESP